MQKMCQCNHKLLTQLYSLYMNQKYCDLTIQLEDGEMKAHTLVLLASSDYFGKLISHDGTLVLKDVKENEMRLIIEIIYKGNSDLQNQSKFPEIYKLLKRFGLSDENATECRENFPTKILESTKGHVEDRLIVNCSQKFSAPQMSESIKKKKVSTSDIGESMTSNNVPVSDLSELMSEKVEFTTSDEEAQGKQCDSNEKAVHHQSFLSRNILEEAYIAAMDMELTDTDGMTSADNWEADRDIKTSSATKRSEDIIGDGSLACTEKQLSVNVNEKDAIKTDNFNHDADMAQRKNKDATRPDHQEVRTESELDISISKSQRTNPTLCGGSRENVESVDVEETSYKTGVKRKRKQNLNSQSNSDIVKGLRSRTNKTSCKTNTVNKPHKDEHQPLSNQNTSEEKNRDSCGRSNSGSDSGELSQDEIGKSLNTGSQDQYKCAECGHVFKSSKLLAGHRHSKHGVALDARQFTVHSCKDCDYKTLEIHRLASHRATAHSTMRPYVCEWCGKNFKLLGALTLHTNIHTKARKHECPQCHKSFSQRGTMKRHIEEKHQHSHRHNCELCTFSAQDRVKLVQHRYTVHSVPLPPGYIIYKCEEDGCKFETFRKQIYSGHLNTHKGIQEFSCDVCHKQFASIGNLRSHRTVHKEKRLACSFPGCEFSTQLSNRLTQHTRLIHTHRDEKPHGCPFCPYKTAVKGNLLKHQKNIHSSAITPSKGDNSVSLKGDNSSEMGDNSAIQMSSEGILKSLLYSSGNIELYDATQPSDASSHIPVNGEVIFDTITVLGLQQSTNEDKT